MRSLLIIAITVVTALTTTTVYDLMLEKKDLKLIKAMESETVTTNQPDVQNKLDELANSIERYQKISQDQIHQAKLREARLTERLDKLDAKLDASVFSMLVNPTDYSSLQDENQDTDINAPDSMVEHSKLEIVSSAEMSQWMDVTLRAGTLDREKTDHAREQVEVSLERFPDMNLEHMQCAKGLCRANFTNTDGGKPDVDSLIGLPPFQDGGFTIHESDGSVSLYFTEPGINFNEIYSEVIQMYPSDKREPD